MKFSKVIFHAVLIASLAASISAETEPTLRTNSKSKSGKSGKGGGDDVGKTLGIVGIVGGISALLAGGFGALLCLLKSIFSGGSKTCFGPGPTPPTPPDVTDAPTLAPTLAPTAPPTMAPTAPPTMAPTAPPTMPPTGPPTMAPTAPPTMPPTGPPTMPPSLPPTTPPTMPPTMPPTAHPTAKPTARPSARPTARPGPGQDCDTLETGKYYKIVNYSSKLPLAVDGTDLGANIWQEADGDEPNKLWHFAAASDSHYYIVNLKSNLAVYAEGENNGDNVVQYPLMYGDLLLEWCFKRQPNGYEIRNRLSSKALDATQDGGYNVLTWDYGDNDHQQWYLVPV